MPMSNEYLAGFFDGEGSIGIKCNTNPKTGNLSYVLVVQITQVNPVVLYFLQEKYGGSMNLREFGGRSVRPAYKWAVHSKDALRFIQDIYPHLLIKRAQADLAFEFVTINNGARLHKSMPRMRRLAVQHARRQCFQTMALLNKRGRQDG